MVSSLTPPSTWSHTAASRPPTSERARRSFGSTMSRKGWPPKPGSTVISSSMSTSGSRSAYGSTAVPGLTASPARAPAARIARSVRTGACTASAWIVTFLAPASAYSGAHRSGSSIIKWQSSGSVACLSRAWTTGRPSVKFGTKWLSMTSTCSQSATAATAAASSASRAKSADKMLGEI